ncbi:Josephin protein [Rhizoctonia solani]|uniref:ubiquitinyl hydrolase 1 n=1 Tax=Rhizoctonia solani TaxID=456999 RepID=A0A8H7I8F8_9AGAM|nr:Josephin protein [Rhizoctonia solani]
MMCGQHALNSVLQGNYFTPPDLAQIAHELDQLEQGVQQSRDGRSTNMDDTGYFSVQVLENALKNAFGLTLIRWRSEEMRPYQAVPDVCPQPEQHWFTIRRFGHPRRKGHWFNLNSFLESPEWVGNTYLGMVLQQAEREGYSVFVVRPLDSSNPEHMLPETEADLLAETLDPGDFEGQVQRISTTRTQPTSSSSNAIEVASSSATTGFENEDMELQRALQASIAAGYGGGSIYEFPDQPPATASASVPRSSSLGLGYGGDASRSSGPPSRRTPVPAADDPPSPQFDANDPVAASAARARLRLEQMQREQTAALQGLGGGYETVELDPAAAARRREAQDRVRRAREEEEEQVRRAMEESLRSHGQGAGDEDLSQYSTPPSMPGGFGATGSRNYDDEDEQLQAALKASLETHAASGAPPVSVRHKACQLRALHARAGASTGMLPPSTASTSSAPITKPAENSEDEDEDEDEEEEEEKPASKSPEVEAKAEVADPDEIRRRRLARMPLDMAAITGPSGILSLDGLVNPFVSSDPPEPGAFAETLLLDSTSFLRGLLRVGQGGGQNTIHYAIATAGPVTVISHPATCRNAAVIRWASGENGKQTTIETEGLVLTLDAWVKVTDWGSTKRFQRYGTQPWIKWTEKRGRWQAVDLDRRVLAIMVSRKSALGTRLKLTSTGLLYADAIVLTALITVSGPYDWKRYPAAAAEPPRSELPSYGEAPFTRPLASLTGLVVPTIRSRAIHSAPSLPPIARPAPLPVPGQPVILTLSTHQLLSGVFSNGDRPEVVITTVGPHTTIARYVQGEDETERRLQRMANIEWVSSSWKGKRLTRLRMHGQKKIVDEIMYSTSPFFEKRTTLWVSRLLAMDYMGRGLEPDIFHPLPLHILLFLFHPVHMSLPPRRTPLATLSRRITSAGTTLELTPEGWDLLDSIILTSLLVLCGTHDWKRVSGIGVPVRAQEPDPDRASLDTMDAMAVGEEMITGLDGWASPPDLLELSPGPGVAI